MSNRPTRPEYLAEGAKGTSATPDKHGYPVDKPTRPEERLPVIFGPTITTTMQGYECSKANAYMDALETERDMLSQAIALANKATEYNEKTIAKLETENREADIRATTYKSELRLAQDRITELQQTIDDLTLELRRAHE